MTTSIITQQLDEARDDPRARARLIASMPWWSLMGNETRQWIGAHGTMAERQYLASVNSLLSSTWQVRQASLDVVAASLRQLAEQANPIMTVTPS
ncbi:hypothetical protein [Jiella avicenniae]|uniref:Uncharacterized protein n=1 Tax=Jiella avicenniae TaxID=2907202 RepID=A0A9X1NWW6_9HYPH|nr:hypothetical protein [Jiella avicenniae]MCE7026408.1 hypothetical protein [Jiella avicenniae]